MIIDFETHFYPREYTSILKQRKDFPRFVEDSSGLTVEYDPELRIPRQRLLGKLTDIETRLEDMAKAGVDMQVLSIPLPGVDKLDAENAIKICKITNESLYKICEKNPSKFAGLALLPVQAGESAGDEFERSVKDLGLKGGYIHSNLNGHYLDSQYYFPVLQVAARLRVPLFVHPTVPFDHHSMNRFRLATTFGLQSDLSLSILRLVFAGILDSLPNLKLVVSHLGSTIPFISNRIDDEFEFLKAEDTKIGKKPSEYFKHLYVDTVTSDVKPLYFAIDFFGVDHIVFGSDYPFWDTAAHVMTLAKSKLAEEDKQKIFSKNAMDLLKIA
jgi:predicted TIM-barrel fold metal-dependent hydrolase